MTITVVLLIVVMILLAVGIYFISQKKPAKQEDGTGLQMLLTQLNNFTQTIDNKIGNLF